MKTQVLTDTGLNIYDQEIKEYIKNRGSGVTMEELTTLLDEKAPVEHTHIKSEITDFPTSMPASDVYDWAKAETKPSYTKSEVGLGNVENKSSATIRGEITKGNVTTALGYTPNTPTEVDTKIDTKINDLESYVITNDDIDSIFSENS